METMTSSSGLIRTIRRNVSARRLRREEGQTPTEYLMIVGIMAAVILIAFIVLFWDKVKVSAGKWGVNAAKSIESSEGKANQPTQ